MALSALNWKYVGVQSFVSGIANSHDAVYTLGTAATYADGSARTPGSGSAWTWAREVSGSTVAAYGTPPTNALSMKYIIAGDTTTTAYTFLAPDTAGQANLVVCGMNRASGAYTTWTNAQPFTSGFSGFWRGTRAFSLVAYDSVSMWESQEACILQYSSAATGVTSTLFFGAVIDPLNTAAGTCESDGRLYVFSGCGSGSTVSSVFLSTSTDGPFSHLGTAQTQHCGIFSPGTTTVVPVNRFGTFQPSSTFIAVNGDIVRLPFSFVNSSNNFIGQARSIYIVRDAQSRLRWDNAGTVVGYIVGANISASQDSYLLTV